MTHSPANFVGGLPVGSCLFEYRIEQVLGHGGFGITYLARDSNLDKPVAIKEYLPSDLAVRVGDTSVSVRSSETQEAFAWGRTSFMKEAQVLARFSHPNLVQIYRFFEANGTAYFVMEYARGTTFASRLSAVGTLAEEKILGVLLPVLDGLEVVHGERILHRDIKPDNIMLKQNDAPVLIDFGAARQSLHTVSKSVMAIATAGYSPLEQYSSGLQQGPWSDLYALGAVAYRAVAGRKPPDAVERIKTDPFVPASRCGSGKYSTQFLTAIDWALAVDAGDRPQSIGEWRQALNGTITPRVVLKTEPQAAGSLDKTEAFSSSWTTDATEILSSSRTGGPTGALPPHARIVHAARNWWAGVRNGTRPQALLIGVLILVVVLAGVAWLGWNQLQPLEPVPVTIELPPPNAPSTETLMQAQLAFMQGQVAYSQGNNKDAINSFAQALKLNPELQHESVLVTPLMVLLSRDFERTAALIRDYQSPEIVAELSRRSGSSGPLGRQRAIRLLKNLGLENRIDYTGDAIAELQEGDSCAKRRAAVLRLGQLNDKRALPPLRELLGAGKGVGSRFAGIFKNSCLSDEASEIIRKLEQR